ncbi:GNAT family N-acetyltransferase [Renibacterium salmoninarum]|uniref:GNAT family N-acetyltransferase n=1 Tax=Renibacterium salmoninarum TaxID=1646 RepID=UPI00131461B2|nr:GNAT family N-acetyltransferase [Renibacterium salmoninarum]
MNLFAAFDHGKRSAPAPAGLLIRGPVESDFRALERIEQLIRGGDGEARRSSWVRSIEREDALLMVAEIGSAVVGYAKASRLEPAADDVARPGFYLVGCSVHPEFRRQSVGRELTKARLSWIAERADEAWYFCNARNESSVAMHDEFGFSEVLRAERIYGVQFSGGEGLLLRAKLIVH